MNTRIALLNAFLTMVITAILFTLFDRMVLGIVHGKQLVLTSLLAFVSGFASYVAVSATCAHEWAA